jgi:probable F420-dependent oxidoreductase
MHPFRFGITASRATDGAAWLTLAHRAEELGYATLVMPDHLTAQLAPMPALAAAASVTTTLRVGTFVLANDYRHPLVMAREAATLALLSAGRFELGLGAGWKQADYRQLGMPYDPPPERIDRLTETLEITRGLFAGEAVTHAGPHYPLRGARLGPPGVSTPRILIGGGGPRMLRLAAREADIVGMLAQFSRGGRPMLWQGTEAATAAKVETVREAAGGRFAQLELNVLVVDCGLVGGGAPLRRSAIALAKSIGPAAVGGSPYVLFGTLAQLREQLLARRERLGISYYVWSARHVETMAPLVAELAGH